jgi:hypothetical protein
MGVGMPEYVLLFRKPHTDLSAAYADLPVTKDKEVYMRAHWQVDAAGFWKSDGDRFRILKSSPMHVENVRRLWIEHSQSVVTSGRSMLRLRRSLELAASAGELHVVPAGLKSSWRLDGHRADARFEFRTVAAQSGKSRLPVATRHRESADWPLLESWRNRFRPVRRAFSRCRIARFIWGASAGGLNSRTIIGAAALATANRRSVSIACRRCLTCSSAVVKADCDEQCLNQ